jgi:hypothetical protein
MVDLRAETSSLSDKIEFTETQGQSAPHHGSTLGTDPSGMAAQREGLKPESGFRRHRCTRRSKEASGKPGHNVARRDPNAWGRTFRTAIDDTTRQWSESAAEARCPIPAPDVRRLGWRRTWGRRKCTAVHAATFQRVQHGAASRLHADGGDPRIPARTGAIRTQSDEPTIPELGLRGA